MKKMEIIAVEMASRESAASKRAAIEFMKKTVSGMEVFQDILSHAKKDKLIDDETQVFIEKLLRIAFIDATIQSGMNFKNIMKENAETATNTDILAHYCAWHGIVERLKDFLVMFDSNETFEKNFERYEQQ
jgi:hypothetical protein